MTTPPPATCPTCAPHPAHDFGEPPTCTVDDCVCGFGLVPSKATAEAVLDRVAGAVAKAGPTLSEQITICPDCVHPAHERAQCGGYDDGRDEPYCSCGGEPPLWHEPLKLTASISRKVNLGNYESAEAFVSVSGVTRDTTPEEVDELLDGAGAMVWKKLLAAANARARQIVQEHGR